MQSSNLISYRNSSGLFRNCTTPYLSELSNHLSPALQAEILEAIDLGLDALGSSFRQVIYYYLEKESGIRRNEIISDPKKFIDGLKTIFGPGAKNIESHLISKINSQFKVHGTTLADAIVKAIQKSSPFSTTHYALTRDNVKPTGLKN